MTTNSLKATNKAIKAPTAVETVLSSAVKLALADVTNNANKAFELFAKQQDASIAYETSEGNLVDGFYTWLTNAKPDYNTFQAVKKHIITSISETKGRAFATIEKWFNTNVMKAVKALGYELPKAESKHAEGMAKHRAELAKVSNVTLLKQITDLKMASDKASLKQALSLSTELEKRTRIAENAVAKNKREAVTKLKTSLKTWVSGMNETELAIMLYVKNNFNDVTKFAKV